MQREGYALQGAGTVMMKEFADNLSSWRMLLLSLLIFLTGAGAVWATIDAVKEVVGEDRFIFLKIFTLPAKDNLPAFAAFLGFLVPIVAIALGFDNVNGEFGRRTMSRILAQPIYRDALLFGKFMAGLATLGVMLTALWLFVIGLGILMLGLPPSTEEIMRSFAFLVATVAYSGVWLALALLFSVIFRSAATAALASLSVWLFFAFFWNMLSPIITQMIAPLDMSNLESALRTVYVGQGVSRISPNTLYTETIMAFLNPTQDALGQILRSQMRGAVSGPLPFRESVAMVWPQFTGLLAGVIVLFTIAYVTFQRQEVRA